MKAVVIAAALLLIASPASACHRFSRWSYPWPQRCGVAPGQGPRIARVVAGEVEPPKSEPAPAPLPAPSKEDLDAKERAQAIERLKVELSIRASEPGR
jgi:hypothetical protein